MKIIRTLLTAALLSTPMMSAALADDGNAARGETLAILGDCQACHTDKAGDGEPFAGGYPISSPMGDIYSSNITPSKTYGIGSYSLEDFTRALRDGIRKDGEHLYPAMPYPSYAKLTDADIKDLYAYFMTSVQPVDEPPKHTTELPFPFGMRSVMAVWNALYLDNTPFKADPNQSDEWNRGAYIVEALAHCSTCHTPRNFMMAEEKDHYLGGSSLGPWFAPNITSSINGGIGSWQNADLITYLQKGHLKGKAQAAGPMGEAVEDSFQHVDAKDLEAIATYIRSVPALDNPAQSAPRDTYGEPFDVDLLLRGAAPVDAYQNLKSGEALYSAYCSSCHQNTGSGTEDQFYPSLFHNTATGDVNPSNAIAAVLYGVNKKVDGKEIYMPSFGPQSATQALSDEQIAKIVQFVYQQYGNPTVGVTEEMVKEIRAGGAAPALMKLQPYLLPGMIFLIAVVLGGIIAVVSRKKRGGKDDH